MHAGYVCRVSMWRSFKSTFMQRTVVSMCTCVCRLRCRGAVLSASVRSSTGNLSFPLWSWIQPTCVIIYFYLEQRIYSRPGFSPRNACFRKQHICSKFACFRVVGGCCYASAAVTRDRWVPSCRRGPRRWRHVCRTCGTASLNRARPLRLSPTQVSAGQCMGTSVTWQTAAAALDISLCTLQCPITCSLHVCFSKQSNVCCCLNECVFLYPPCQTRREQVCLYKN